MIRPMEAFLLLADSAQTDPSGKVHILGGGWSVIGPEPTPSALIIFLRMTLEEAAHRRRFKLRLLDAAGLPVLLSPKDDERPIEFDGQLNLPVVAPDAPPGGPPGDVQSNLTLALAPLPLRGGRRYDWVFEIDGDVQARASFVVRPGEDEDEDYLDPVNG